MSRRGSFATATRLGSLAVFVTLFVISLSAPAQTIDDIVDQIDVASYQDYLQNRLYTRVGDSRGRNGAEHDPARDFILNELQSFGLDASLHHFSYSYYTGENVVAVQTGTLFPDHFVIIGGHYDSVNNPGADDNASGTAGMLEAARVLSQFEFESSIIYMAWDLEELGLIGAKKWVREHVDDDIVGVLNMDMIAYNPSNSNRATVYGKDLSLSLKLALMNALNEYSPHITVNDGGSNSNSDNAAFESYGIPGVCLIEYNWFRNPNYHRQSDTVDTPGYIDYEFATNLVRGVTGCAAELARVVSFDDCLLFDAVHFQSFDVAKLSVVGGTPGRSVIIVYGTKPGSFDFRNHQWCVSFGIAIRRTVARDRVLARGVFDDEGAFRTSRYIAAMFRDTRVLMQAAMDETCPDVCMSNILDRTIP